MLDRFNGNKMPGIFVAVSALLVYANSLGNGFVWDDFKFIVNNPLLRESPLSLFSGIYPFYLIDAAPYYRPLTVFTFMIEERLHGLNPFPMHLVNVLLHAGNAVLVYRLARTRIKNNQAAVLAGLLFAVHPINTEGVDFISTRNDILACFFVTVAYLLHQRSLLRGNIISAVEGAMFFFAAIFSKENAFALVPLIIALEVEFRRVKISGIKFGPIRRLLAYAAVAVGYLILTRQKNSATYAA